MIPAKVSKNIIRNRNQMAKDLQTLIRIPSVSAKNQGLEECASALAKMMKHKGLKVELLRVNGKKVPPVIYGEIKSKKNPEKTLLFYNHYDVQPAEPFELWADSPFGARIRGNKIFGRGASDDKGEIVTRLQAVEAFVKETGDVPCNIKFMIEGEEEIGSNHVGQYLKKFKQKLSCDAVIWEFGYVDSKNRPIISLGMKGLLYVQLYVRESKRDAHSSLAVLIKNPAWRLVRALNTLRDDNGRILIGGWYDEVEKYSKKEIEILKQEPFDLVGFRKEYGISKLVGNKKGLELKKSLVGGPTCNIAGIYSGYTGKGAKTVLPAEAYAKLDFRLVPFMDPKRQYQKIKKHLHKKGFDDVKITILNAEAAQRTSPEENIVETVKSAADRVFGNSVTSLSSAGTGPMNSFTKILGSPCVAVGGTYVYSRIHSPNEFASLGLLKKTSLCMANIIKGFGDS